MESSQVPIVKNLIQTIFHRVKLSPQQPTDNRYLPRLRRDTWGSRPTVLRQNDSDGWSEASNREKKTAPPASISAVTAQLSSTAPGRSRFPNPLPSLASPSWTRADLWEPGKSFETPIFDSRIVKRDPDRELVCTIPIGPVLVPRAGESCRFTLENHLIAQELNIWGKDAF